jgi:hypothetical protein
VRYDAEGLVRDWVNGPSGLAGAGQALPKGAHFRRLRGPYQGAYLVLAAVGGTAELTPEKPAHRARISGQIYGISKEGAAVAAVAYANAIEALRGVPVVMGPATCLFACDVTGPLYAPDADEERYVVDADFYLA